LLKGPFNKRLSRKTLKKKIWNLSAAGKGNLVGGCVILDGNFKKKGEKKRPKGKMFFEVLGRLVREKKAHTGVLPRAIYGATQKKCEGRKAFID